MPNERGLNDQADTDKTEEQLFLEISKAVKSDDYAALDRLVVAERQPEDQAPRNDKPEEEEDKSTNTEEASNEKPAGEEVEGGTEEAGEDEEPGAVIARLQAELAASQALAHKLKSDAGRVPSLQRKLADVDRKLQEMASRPSTSAASKRDDKRVLSEKLAQIKEHDPVLGDAVQDLVENAINELRSEFEPKVQAVQRASWERDVEQTLDVEMQKLERVVPNAREVFDSPMWKEWKEELPATWRNLAESMYAEDVIPAIQKYAEYVYNRYPELALQAQQSVADTSHQTTTPASPEAARITEQRNKKLSTRVPGASSVSAKDTPLMDEAALFAKVFTEEAAKLKR